MRILSLVFLFIVSLTTYGTSISEIDNLFERTYPLLIEQPDSAMLYAEEALELSVDINYEWGIANSYYIQGYIYQNRGEYSAALLMFLKSSQILKYELDLKSQKTYERVLTYCGYILRQHSKYEEAIKYFNDALKIATSNDLKNDQLMLIYNKSLVYRRMGDYENAIKNLLEVESLANQFDNNTQLISSWMAMGNVYYEMKVYNKARNYFYRILHSEQFAPLSSRTGAWKNLGMVYQSENKFDSAQFCYLNSIELMDGLESSSDLSRRKFEAFLAISELYLENKMYDQGQIFAEKAEKYYSQVDRTPEHFKVFKLLSDIRYKQNESNISYQHMSKYYEENTKYQEHQEEVMRLRDKFKIDILLAGFYSEVDKENSTSMYQMIIGFLIIGIVLWVGVSRFRVNVVRKELEREIHRINKDSLV